MIRFRFVKGFFILVAMGFFQDLVALQTKMVTDNEVVEACIAHKELTRIAAFHDRIRNAYGIENTYELKNDPTQGALFIKPTLDNASPFTLFIATEKNHNYVLHLTPKDQLGDTLLLKNKALLSKTKNLKRSVLFDKANDKGNHERT